MSRYLEEAAALLRKSVETVEQESSRYSQDRQLKNVGRERLAREFAVLAAIDKGLLPAELTETVLEQICQGGDR